MVGCVMIHNLLIYFYPSLLSLYLPPSLPTIPVSTSIYPIPFPPHHWLIGTAEGHDYMGNSLWWTGMIVSKW